MPAAERSDGELQAVFGSARSGGSGHFREGSLFFTRPTLNTYGEKRADLLAMAQDLFGMVLPGAVRIVINQTYPLTDAAQAHRDLEERRTVGSTVLIV